MAAAVFIIGLWWLVAHNAGSGWVQVLGELVFGALLIGIGGPLVVVARAEVRVRSAPADAIAGLPVEIHVVCRTRVRVRPVEPPGPEVFVGPVGRGGAVDGVLALVPVRRGVHDSVTLDIASAAPFALQWWTRRVQLAGSIVGLLEAGTPVLLGTREATGPVLGPVADRRGAGRRLARAVAEPGAATVGSGGAAP